MDIVEKLEKHYNIKEGDSSELIEALMGEESLEKSDGEDHRHYSMKNVVVKVRHTYVRYSYYHVTGGLGWSDLGLEEDHLVDYIRQVYPIETVSVKYVTEKP